jgi:hypothetical protein
MLRRRATPATSEAQPDVPGAMPDVVPTPPAATANAPVLTALPAALGSLYTQMTRTTDPVAPMMFLNLLREVAPYLL